jgi:hypothetical protein
MHTLQHSRIALKGFNVKLVHGVEIAEVLTTATKAPEVIADALAWIESTDVPITRSGN